MLSQGQELDTSGVVHLREQVPVGVVGLACFGWEDLSPFAQGYVEAMFAGLARDAAGRPTLLGSRLVVAPRGNHTEDVAYVVTFSDLAPETLTMILRDCEAMWGEGLAGTAEVGRSAWAARQAGLCVPRFPPLRVYLNDDGKVSLTEGAR